MKIKRILSILVLATLMICALTMSASAEGGAYVITHDHQRVDFSSAAAAIDAVCMGEVKGDVYIASPYTEQITVTGECTIFTNGMLEIDLLVFDESVYMPQIVEDPNGNPVVSFYANAEDPYLFKAGEDYYYDSSDFIGANVEGKLVVLYGDVVAEAPVSGVTVDLNGHNLVFTSNAFAGENFVYSSVKGGAIYSHGILASSSTVHIGYSAAGTTAGERVSVYTYAHVLMEAAVGNFYNTDLFILKPHTGNYQYCFMVTWGRLQTLNVENSNIYNLGNSFLFGGNGVGKGFDVVIKNSKIYGGGGMAGLDGDSEGDAPVGNTNPFEFYNVQVYGVQIPNRAGCFGLIADKDCTFTVANSEWITGPEGLVLTAVPSNEKVSVTYPSAYNGAPVTYAAEFKSTMGFATEVNDNYAFTADGTPYFEASDFTAANVNGKKVVLNSDVVVTETITNANIDLNGYNLTVNVNLTDGQANYIYNSNTETQSTIWANAPIVGATVKTFAWFGYSDASTKAAGRITMINTVSVQQTIWGNQMYMYNVDVIGGSEATGHNSKTWFGQINGSAQFSAENCNFYFSDRTVFIHGNKTSGHTFTFTNCNLYMNGGWFGGSHWNNDAYDTFKFVNSNVYGTTIWGSADYANKETCWTFDFGVGCSISSVPSDSGYTYALPEGYILVSDVKSVTPAFTYYASADATEPSTLAGTYTAGYLVAEKTASTEITVYDKSYGDASASVLTTIEGYVGATPVYPAIRSWISGNVIYAPTGEFALYNAAGECVYTGAPTIFSAEMVAAGPYTAYPVVKTTQIAFEIDGVYYAASEFTSANVSGKKVVLYSDITVTETVSGVTIDLNGYNLTIASVLAFTGNNPACYIYNSNVENASTIWATTNIFGGSTKTFGYIGYSDASTKAAGRITLVNTASVVDEKWGNQLHMSNVDVVCSMSNHDSKTFFGQCSGGAWTAENCNFYFGNRTTMIHSNGNEGMSYVFKGCNFFMNGGYFGGSHWGKTNPCTFVLENSNVYGDTPWATSAYANQGTCWSFNIGAGCEISSTPAASGYTQTLPEGCVLVPNNAVKTVSFSYVNADGTIATFEGTYSAGMKVGTERDLKAFYATFLRNVNLDVSINFNLYIPTTYTLAGEYDTTEIDGVEYYVVTVKSAPKDATGDNLISLTVNGVEVKYNASLVNYMKALMNITSETDYVKDSQAMAKYVLNYVKSAALAAYGEVDTTAIDALLEVFTLSETDKTITGAMENVTAITGIVGAALDLNSNVGMVIQVAKDYVGTVTVSMAATESVSVTYGAVAEEDRYIVIGDIEIFNFTNTLTVTNSEGETMSYNLATYVDAKKTEVAYATYAYAMAAKAYHKTYATPEIVK